MKLLDIQKIINAAPCQNNKINIAVLSNITLEPYFNALLQSEFSEDARVNVLAINYEDFEKQENSAMFTAANYIVVFLNFANLYSNAFIDLSSKKSSVSTIFKDVYRQCVALYQYIKKQSESPVLWFGFEDYCYQYNCVNGNIICNDNLIDKLNNEMYYLLKEQDIYRSTKQGTFSKILVEAIVKEIRWNAPYAWCLSQ